MSGVLSRRLFPILQLARMALVFTAISNAWCTLFLWHALREDGLDLSDAALWQQAIAVALISTGLYGFGMTLNDIIDRRRDQQLAAHRPLPSGRVGVGTAHVIAALLVVMALVASILFERWTNQGWMSVVLVAWTAVLIVFYDLAGKYLVALGLLTLGLIRFFHAVIPAPQLPLLWHPLLLLNHVAILSAVAYHWEQKRPPLTRAHWLAVIGGLVTVNVMAMALLASRHGAWPPPGLRVGAELLLPGVATLAFLGVAHRVWRRSPSPREAGQQLMLYGLLWLIVYDACFVAGYVRNWVGTLAVLALLPVAYFSVRLMRWWSKLIALSQKPQFKRARV
jgi:hypothetical protein